MEESIYTRVRPDPRHSLCLTQCMFVSDTPPRSHSSQRAVMVLAWVDLCGNQPWAGRPRF